MREYGIPSKEIEERSSGSGPVMTRQMTDEERVKYGLADPPIIKNRDGESVKPPIIIPSKIKGEIDMSKKYPQITKEFLEAEFAAGKSALQIQREQEMPVGSIGHYIKKTGAVNPNSKKGNEATPPKAKDGMEEFRQKLSDVIGERNAYRDAVGRLENENENLRAENLRTLALTEQVTEKYQAEIAHFKQDTTSYESKIAVLIQERDSWKQATQDLEAKYVALIDAPAPYVAPAPVVINCDAAIEQAIMDLKGIQAVRTAHVIARLWNWTSVDELKDAQNNIEQLIKTAD